MYKIFNALLTIVWVMDILNLPIVNFLDTEIPINTLAWILIFIFIPGTTITQRIYHDK